MNLNWTGLLWFVVLVLAAIGFVISIYAVIRLGARPTPPLVNPRLRSFCESAGLTEEEIQTISSGGVVRRTIPFGESVTVVKHWESNSHKWN